MDKIEKIAKRLVALDAEVAKHHWSNTSEHPAAYVGTFGKYANHSIDGMWVDLMTFDGKEDFDNFCKNVLHKDEPDAEPMIQDTSNMPESLCSGYGTFDSKTWDYLAFLKEHVRFEEDGDAVTDSTNTSDGKATNYGDYDKDVVDAIIEHGHSIDDVENASVYPECYDMTDVAEQIVRECGEDAFTESAWEDAFDYEHYGREWQWDMTSEEREQYEGMTDEEIGEDAVEMQGGLKELGFETVKAYADFHKLGDMLEYDGDWIRYDGGYIQIIQ